MQNLTIAQTLTMSSREIAELTEKRHPDVKRDIERMIFDLQGDVSKFAHIYLDSMNRQQTEYLLDRDHTEFLLTGYSAVHRMRVIKRWHDLEKLAAKPALPENYISALEALLESKKSEAALALVNKKQEEEIHCLQNLFQTGMTPVQFCKQLNGVNVMGINLLSYAHFWCTGFRGGWRILLIDFVDDFNNREMIRHEKVYPTGLRRTRYCR